MELDPIDADNARAELQGDEIAEAPFIGDLLPNTPIDIPQDVQQHLDTSEQRGDLSRVDLINAF